MQVRFHANNFGFEFCVSIFNGVTPPPRVDEEPSVVKIWEEESGRIVGSYGWVPNRISVQGSERALVLALIAGELCVIGDGSYKDCIGTAVVQLRSLSSANIIWVYCQTPGLPESQSPYRSELTGLFAGVLVVTWLWQAWSPLFPLCQKPKVKIGCDGLSALRNAFVFQWLHPAQPQFDLVSSLRVAISASGIDWDPLHVKGHMDSEKQWKDLTWWERRNVEVDQRACQYREQLARSNGGIAPNPRFFSEPCALFINGVKLSSLKRTVLEELVILPQLLEEWCDHQRLTKDGFSQVDWNVVERAMKSLPAGLQRWCTKHTVGVCGVGKVRHRWNPQDSPICPMCEEVEDHLHVPRCASETATSEWNLRIEAFSLWLAEIGTAPEISESLLQFLQDIREPVSNWAPSWAPLNTIPHVALVQAITSQRMIGSQAFLEGLLSKAWGPLQESYFRSKGSRRSGTKWAASVSKQLILIGFYMWESRNKVHHSEASSSKQLLSQQVNDEIRHQMGLDPSGLPLAALRQLAQPVGKILSLPLASREKWLRWIKLERSLLERSLHARKKMMYLFTHSGRQRRRAFRSSRVFRQARSPKRVCQPGMSQWMNPQ